ncbi:hypothetical protein ACJX0J_036018 [Zea mays]
MCFMLHGIQVNVQELITHILRHKVVALTLIILYDLLYLYTVPIRCLASSIGLIYYNFEISKKLNRLFTPQDILIKRKTLPK